MPDSKVVEWESKTMGAAGSCAILVHGPLLATHDNAASLQRHVAGLNGAPIFHYGPYRHFESSPATPGVETPVCEPVLTPVHATQVLRRYGMQLKKHALHQVPTSQFADDAASLVSPSRRLPGVDPAVLLARLHDIHGAIRLLRAWESENGRSFDQIVLLRSDLALYSRIDVDVKPGEVGLAPTEGFNAETGDRNTRLRTLCAYRNRLTGDFVSGAADEPFNADVLVFHRTDLGAFDDLYRRGIELLTEGAPPDLDTLLYLLLVSRARLQVRSHPDWVYEICRASDPDAVAQGDVKAALIGPRLALLPGSHHHRTRHGGERKRVAVLLYGLLRDYTKTAGSIIEKVVKPSNANVFYYGPAQTDHPVRGKLGVFDDQGFFLSNPKGDFETLQTLDGAGLRSAYGSVLSRMEMHQVPQEHFLTVSGEVFPRDEWMFMLSPHRLLSMVHNMNGVVNLLRRYEDEVGYAFDEVVITRPDLAFYSNITADVKPGELHIASGEGFDPNGHEHVGSAPAYFYKNASTGDYTPAGRRCSFNDQIFVLKRQDLVHFYNIYDDLLTLLRNRIPGSPETIFYMLFVQRAGLSLVTHTDWVYEIFRMNDPVIKSVNDTPDIVHIDPHSPKAARFHPLPPPAFEPNPAAEPVHQLAPQPTPEPEPPLKPPIVSPGDGLRVMRNLFQADSHKTLWSKARSRLLLSKARRHRRAGKLEAAERCYAEVLRHTPHIQKEWVQYGHVLKDQGHWHPAVGAYEFALLLKPGDPDATLHHDSLIRDIASR